MKKRMYSQSTRYCRVGWVRGGRGAEISDQISALEGIWTSNFSINNPVVEDVISVSTIKHTNHYTIHHHVLEPALSSPPPPADFERHAARLSSKQGDTVWAPAFERAETLA